MEETFPDSPVVLLCKGFPALCCFVALVCSVTTVCSSLFLDLSFMIFGFVDPHFVIIFSFSPVASIAMFFTPQKVYGTWPASVALGSHSWIMTFFFSSTKMYEYSLR